MHKKVRKFTAISWCWRLGICDLVYTASVYIVTIRCSGGIATTKPDFKSKLLQICDEIRPKLILRPFLHPWKHKTYCTTTSITEYVRGIKKSQPNNNKNPTTKIPIQFSPGSTPPNTSWEVLINTFEQFPQRLVKLLTYILLWLRVLRPIQTVSWAKKN